MFAASLGLTGCGEKNSNQQASDSGLEKAILGEQYGLPFEGTWFVTGGPHNFKLPIGAPIDGTLASDLDFAPKPVVPCPPGKEIVLKDWGIVASKSGIVTVAGDEKNQKDPNHSIVQIKHADGKSSRYVHSADIEVKKGDTVKQNQVIGYPSCEVPPDGYTTGVHLDFSVLDANGNPVDIRGLTFGGWAVDSSSKNYQGTLSKNGEKTRTADGARCDTDTVCGGIRNDLTNTPNKGVVVAGPKDPISPISGKVNEKSVSPTPTAETKNPAVEKKISISKKPEDLFKVLLTSPISPDILPQGMSSRGVSAGEIDATGKALKQVGAVTIQIEDPISSICFQPNSPSTCVKGTPNASIFYGIFPDSSAAKSASELFGTHFGNGQALENFPYSAKIYANAPIFSVAPITVIVVTVENVTLATTLSSTDSNVIRSRSILLTQAAIKHLEKVGK